MAKNIVLFIDGTWEANDGHVETNVGKLFEACRFKQKPGIQTVYYLPGVGTDAQLSRMGSAFGAPRPDNNVQRWAAPPLGASVWPLNRLTGGAFGYGMGARIREAYAFLCKEYRRSEQDKIFIFGFSRGAFAARSLAGFISKVGILMQGYEDRIPDAYKIYESGTDEVATDLKEYLLQLTGASAPQPELNDLPIHFLGVWDTVGALGLPWRISESIAKRTEYHDVEVPPNVMHARHAMALHELRKHFPVLLWENKRNHQHLKQVWFPGAHGDVGGGYPEDESGLSTSALRWMAHEAMHEGLLVEMTHPAFEPQPSNVRLHHKMTWFYALFKPQVRSQLAALLEQCKAAKPDIDAACQFSASCRDHLLSKQEYRFFSSRVNAALRHVDDTAAQVCFLSRLTYNYPFAK
ncbi:DUF2235 domain-containing protein [Paraburkholderia sp. EG286B]|uniref:DUF2235 domain-containing protein n=1 Tax=Paraburkholderia sp. EG286B TaxID=3237011 RepID=UPI0034D3868A